MLFRKAISLRWFLLLFLVCCMVFAAGKGAVAIPPMQVLRLCLQGLGWLPENADDRSFAVILFTLRLPRVCLAALVGSGLAVSGASMQGLFRNPLADPGLIGISSGASLCAVLVIVLTGYIPQLAAFPVLRHYLLNIVTFIGAAITSLLVLRFSQRNGKTVMATLLLAGIAVNALTGALTGLVTYTAKDEELRNITFWSMGSLGGATWTLVLVLLPFVLIPLAMLPRLGKSLNAYSLGEAEAFHLGINVGRLKWQVILFSTMAVGASVAVSGIIGFIGLVVPHILRTVAGGDHRRLLANSALLGGALLVLADTLSRTVIAPQELPIGIVTALIGTPVFIFLLARQKKHFNM